MRLYFLRHGLAGDSTTWTGADEQRPLTPEGVARMQVSARTISALALNLDEIITSPYVRARQTADIVAAQLGLPVTAHASLVPGFSFPMLERLLNTRLQAGALLLVGHEDDFSQLIGRLMGGGRVVMKKGSLARVDLLQLQPPAGILSWLLPPKLLASE
ncbi:MAG: histidine phosphatase family protein [Chloroflexi bacterium]|nr:histidine phosphatase family protein [Chloroflexota bacterium]